MCEDAVCSRLGFSGVPLTPTDVSSCSGASTAPQFLCLKRSPSAVLILQNLGLLYAGVPAPDSRWREILGRRVGAKTWAAYQTVCPSRANMTLLKLQTLIPRRRPRLVFLPPPCAESCPGPTASKRGWIFKAVSVCSYPAMMQTFVCPNGL